MAQKALSTLITGLSIQDSVFFKDRMVSGISYDSRKVEKGHAFCALKGFHTDGHKYIERAIKAGAETVFFSSPPLSFDKNISYLQVPDCRKALSHVAATFYDRPSSRIKVIGVTGTDGKSSTCYFIKQLLDYASQAAGLLSTVSIERGQGLEANPFRQSTPEAPEIHGILNQMLKSGKEYAALEATSHGLSERTSRLRDVEFTIGVFTNISHEHLEFHGSFDQYRYDKANLFRKAADFTVVNEDDPNASYFQEVSEKPSYTYSIKERTVDMRASGIQADLRGCRFNLLYNGKSSAVDLPLIGSFNVENALAALLAVVKATGKDPKEYIHALGNLKGVPGRMSKIEGNMPFTVIVDYAHTPGSFKKVLPFIRYYTKGRLIAVFGSAGERDKGKRPLQGEIASEYCDMLVLSDEDPRGEEPMAILHDIKDGCSHLRDDEVRLIPDREEAMRKAFRSANQDDTVLLLGKGHEKSIIYRDGPREWDEETVARRVLEELGYKT